MTPARAARIKAKTLKVWAMLSELALIPHPKKESPGRIVVLFGFPEPYLSFLVKPLKIVAQMPGVDGFGIQIPVPSNQVFNKISGLAVEGDC